MRPEDKRSEQPERQSERKDAPRSGNTFSTGEKANERKDVNPGRSDERRNESRDFGSDVNRNASDTSTSRRS